MRRIVFLAVAALFTSPALAAEFAPVSDKQDFLSMIEGRELLLRLWDVSLNVKPDGQITGNMLGWDVTGSWNWQNGFFCREMDWSGYAIEYNCQLVEADGTGSMRFTVDQGAGKSAVFALK